MAAALVTGAGRRVGRALALALSRHGHHVLVHYNGSEAGAEETVAMIQAAGGTADILRADLSKAAEVEGLFPAALRLKSPIDLLVNSASLFERDELTDLDPDRFDRQIAVNLKAPALLSKAFAAALPADQSGLIVNITDAKVIQPDPVFLSYGLSKIGLEGLTRMLALALAPKIRVNAIAPGLTLRSGAQTDEGFAAAWHETPLERSSTPEDLSSALLYLIDAKSVTGHQLVVDGGVHLLGPLRRNEYEPAE